MSSLKDDMIRASTLIKTQRYDEARQLLRTIDHPTAREWLMKIDQLDPPRAAAPAAMPAYTTPEPDPYTVPRAAAQGYDYAPPSSSALRQPAYSEPAASPIQADRPRRKGGLGTVLVLLLTALIGGMIIGGLLFASSLLIYLIFLSILVAAALAGGLLSNVVGSRRFRRPAVAFVFGILMGLVVYGTYWVGEYGRFIFELRQELLTSLDEEDAAQVDLLLEELTGQSGIGGWMALGDLVLEDVMDDLEDERDDPTLDDPLPPGIVGFVVAQARQGLSITRTRDSVSNSLTGTATNGSTLSEELTYGYWGLELLIATLFPAFLAAGAARAPFCEETGKWLSFETVGYVNRKNRKAFLMALKQGGFAQAAPMLEQQLMRGVTITVMVGRCTAQSPEARVRVFEQRGRNQSKIFDKTVSMGQFNQLTGMA